MTGKINFWQKFKIFSDSQTDKLLILLCIASILWCIWAFWDTLPIRLWQIDKPTLSIIFLCLTAILMLWRWFVNIVQYFEKFKYLSRTVQVLLSSLASMVILSGLGFGGYLGKDALPATLVVLVVSAPVAFTVWRFRDENQSKDINLKEFQKISEWVTGAHFGEAEKEKHTQKFSGSLENGETALKQGEYSREYHQTAENKLALHTFSKRDGAVGLQIAAVYNLLPFYRGDYGRDFEKPAVHLLLSAWKVLQHDILQQLEQCDDLEKQKEHIKQLHQRADTPLGQAITRVLLACGHDKKPLLHRHQEVFRGICLSGMDFELAGVETEILREMLFCGRDCIGAQLQGVRNMNIFNYSKIIFDYANLIGANFSRAELSDAKIRNANLSLVKLDGAKLLGSVLSTTNLSDAWLHKTELQGSTILNVKFIRTYFDDVDLHTSELDNIDLSDAEISRANLLYINEFVIHKLCNAKSLLGSLLDAENFAKFSPMEQQDLQEKGLIILHQGSEKITSKLICKKGGRNEYPATEIPFPIDLAKTRAANPDWEIWIE